MRSAKVTSLELANMLDTTTYQFIERKRMSIECYKDCAILSHRSYDEEITMKKYKQFVSSAADKLKSGWVDSIMGLDDAATVTELSNLVEDARSDPSMKPLSWHEKLSVAKVLRFCNAARLNKRLYAWVDTCCIDRKNTDELSRAMGSMWDYYSQCSWCYVYMPDVSGEPGRLRSEFKNSDWFKRGWTLQELLASYGSTIFFDHRWQRIEFDEDENLTSIISSCTDISPRFLESPKEACVAVKMSWLSRRETRFPEDMAYCMLGLFGVHLSVDYREGGESAFRRLQMALIDDARYQEDESIFAWTRIPEGSEINSSVTACGLLAPWPVHFADCGSLALAPNGARNPQLEPKVLSARDGVVIQVPAKHAHMNNGKEMNWADLAKDNRMEISLNVKKEDTMGEPAPQRTGLFGIFGRHNTRPALVTLALIKNPSKKWRRQPSNALNFSGDTKQRRNTMPLAVPNKANSDDATQLQIAGPGGFGDGMRAAIDARRRGL